MERAHGGSAVHPVVPTGKASQGSLHLLERAVSPIPSGVLGMMPLWRRDQLVVVRARDSKLVAEVVDILLKFTGVVQGFLKQLKSSLPRDQARDHHA